MLVLSRKKNERIKITCGEEIITVVVVEIRGDKCRIGCEASKNVSVDRQEVFDAKRKNQPDPEACGP